MSRKTKRTFTSNYEIGDFTDTLYWMIDELLVKDSYQPMNKNQYEHNKAVLIKALDASAYPKYRKYKKVKT